MNPIYKFKSFGIGLCLAGAAACLSALQPLSKGSCAGSCAQCGSCGLMALPLVLWLAAEKWLPSKKIRALCARQNRNPRRIFSTVITSEDKAK